MMWPFEKPKPTPPGVIIRNVLGEVIDRVEGVWHLANADLHGRQWPHADLSGLSLDGANCEGIIYWALAWLVRLSVELPSRMPTSPTHWSREPASDERIWTGQTFCIPTSG
jgi:hypothetical protein